MSNEMNAQSLTDLVKIMDDSSVEDGALPAADDSAGFSPSD